MRLILGVRFIRLGIGERKYCLFRCLMMKFRIWRLSVRIGIKKR